MHRRRAATNLGKVGETLARGPSTTSERLRRRRTFCWLDKELRNWDGQCLGETIQNVDGRVFLSPLETTNVGSIYTGIKGQPLLREAASHPDPPQVPSHQRAPFHALRRTVCRLLNHWPYPVNYAELPMQFGHKLSGSGRHAGPGWALQHRPPLLKALRSKSLGNLILPRLRSRWPACSRRSAR
jgi:hypothetical protein